MGSLHNTNKNIIDILPNILLSVDDNDRGYILNGMTASIRRDHICSYQYEYEYK